MGSFSWLKADDLTNVANIVYGKSFKFLIPKEFGGGFILDTYQDYGYLGRKDNGSPKYDMYELLAFWNIEEVNKKRPPNKRLVWVGETIPKMKEIDSHTNLNRNCGIAIGCEDRDILHLKYPLKLVSPSYKGTYEDCVGISFGDPNQGCGNLYRKNLENNKYKFW